MEPITVEYHYLEPCTAEIPKAERTYIEEKLNSNLGELLPEIKEVGVSFKVDVAPNGSIVKTRFVNCPDTLVEKIQDAINE